MNPLVALLFAGLLRNQVARAQQLHVREAVDGLRRFDVEGMKEALEKIRDVSSRPVAETST